jgi:hypothetical protein
VYDVAFDASRDQEESIARGIDVLQGIERAPELDSTGFRARVYDISVPGEERYAVFAFEPFVSHPTHGRGGLGFFALVFTTDSARVIGPYSLFDAMESWVERVDDIDGDGNPEVVYCTAFEGTADPRLRKAIRLEGGMWTRVLNGPGIGAECRPRTPEQSGPSD